MITTRQMRRQLAVDNLKWPRHLVPVPPEQWPLGCFSAIPADRHPTAVWRSQDFLVLIFAACNGIERLTVQRTEYGVNRAKDDIKWETLQRLKAECGRGKLDAVEIFPNDRDVVNVANMRHLWVLPEPLSFAWRREP